MKSAIFALAPLALAAPLERRTVESFTVIAAHSTSPVHLSSWVIRDGGVFLSGDSSAYCPPDTGVNCADYSNTSAFVADTGSPIGLGLSTGVPGGQYVFVNRDGSLGYTQAHSGYVPTGAAQGGFSRSAPASSNDLGQLGYVGAANGGNAFFACQVSSGDYQVFVNTEHSETADCIGISGLTSQLKGNSAWQYN